MTDDRLANCIWLLIRKQQSGDIFAGAMLADYARLKVLAREPLDALLRAYAPSWTRCRIPWNAWYAVAAP